MKGLIRNNFYSMGGGMKIAFLMSAVLMFIPLFTKDYKILNIVIAIQIFCFISNTGAALRADEVSKWNKFELTLPVKASTVVAAKYLSFGALILCGFAMSAATGGIAAARWQEMSVARSLAWGYSYGLTLSVITSAVMYPVMLKIGTEKNELILLVSAFFAIGFMAVIAFFLAPFTGGMNMTGILVGEVSLAGALILLVVSYRISLWIYRKKEFC